MKKGVVGSGSGSISQRYGSSAPKFHGSPTLEKILNTVLKGISPLRLRSTGSSFQVLGEVFSPATLQNMTFLNLIFPSFWGQIPVRHGSIDSVDVGDLVHFWKIVLTPIKKKKICVPDPDPPDPHVFGPPGSRCRAISQRYGSGSFYQQDKIVRKILIPTFLLILLDFYLWKMM